MLDMIFLIAAVGGGTIMLVQLVLAILGLDDSFDLDVDVGDALDGVDAGSHLLEILSFRTIVGGLTFFGFAGKASLASGMSTTSAVAIAIAAFLAGVYGLYWVMKQMYKLQSAGNEDIRNAIGKRAQVTVAVPSARSGAGKIQVRMQNRIVEYRAVTDDTEVIRSGSEVAILDCLGSDTVEITSIPTEQLQATEGTITHVAQQ